MFQKREPLRPREEDAAYQTFKKGMDDAYLTEEDEDLVDEGFVSTVDIHVSGQWKREIVAPPGSATDRFAMAAVDLLFTLPGNLYEMLLLMEPEQLRQLLRPASRHLRGTFCTYDVDIVVPTTAVGTPDEGYVSVGLYVRRLQANGRIERPSSPVAYGGVELMAS